MIAIIDYGLGNVQAIGNVYKELNITASIINDANNLKNADKLILPGVGAFDQAIQRLQKSGLRDILDAMVIEKRTPVLGICVGMQMLGLSSEEGKLEGLGWIDAEVKRIDFSSDRFSRCIPHMGWNNIRPLRENALLYSLNISSRFYFLHSYFMDCNKNEDVLAVTDYGGDFASIVNYENIYGVQFHPEKSHGFGIQLLKNFAEI